MASSLDDGQATKAMLGMGELFAIHQGGTITPDENQDFGFLEIQDGTIITALTFQPDPFPDIDGYDPIEVTKYNVTVQGTLLIPPVYNQQNGSWTSIETTGGQVNIYGKNPIG